MTVIVTGSAGLIGSEAVRFFCERGHAVIGVDNDMRKVFFGPEASTDWNRARLEADFAGYRHLSIDIRDGASIDSLFAETEIELVIHAAAQPSHDWAAKDPVTDFTVNANGTLALLEATRKHCPEPLSFSPRQTRSMATRPISCPSSRRRRGGRSTPPTRMSTASTKP